MTIPEDKVFESMGRENPHKKEEKNRTGLAIGFALIMVCIVVGAITITYLQEVQNSNNLQNLDDIPDENLLTLSVTDSPPYAKDGIGIDYVDGKISHTLPTIQEVIRTLVWSKTVDKERLLEIEDTIMQGAKLNDNKISQGEMYMLEIINWSAYPEVCENDIFAHNCQYYGILYNQGLYQDGEISRDQYWLNIKQWADDKTIAEVEKNLNS